MKENINDRRYGQTSSGQSHNSNEESQRNGEYSPSDEMEDMEEIVDDDMIFRVEDEDDMIDDD